jgi:FixJ family two-component response regulator
MTTGGTVHVVEDDPGMRDALTLLLQTAGFNVRSYSSAEMLLAEVRPFPANLPSYRRAIARDGWNHAV